MASSSSSSPVKFIEKALLATGSFALSYTDPDQKWLIRKHLTSFLQDFPDFELSTDTFNHNNGAKVQLFCLEGSLRIRSSIVQLPTVQLTIWIHENYPLTPPLVFINPNSIPIRTNHPFVNSSGFTNSRYIETWEYPRCNLLDFIRNLKKVLANDHPFVQTDSIPTRNLSVSRTEALDRLATSLHYDALTIIERSEEEIENLWKLQSAMKQRSESVKTIITELETERETLKERALKLKDDSDVLATWVEMNYHKLMKSTSMDMGIEEMFEIESEVEGLAEDDAIEDVLNALEEEAARGELEIGSYLKQVRVLAREQFSIRHNRFKIQFSTRYASKEIRCIERSKISCNESLVMMKSNFCRRMERKKTENQILLKQTEEEDTSRNLRRLLHESETANERDYNRALISTLKYDINETYSFLHKFMSKDITR